MFLNVSCNMSSNVVNFKSLDGKEVFTGKISSNNDGMCEILVLDDSQKVISKAMYEENKYKIPEKFEIDCLSGEKLIINYDNSNKKIVSSSIKVKRSFYDWKISIFKDDEIVVDLKCKSLIRRHIFGKYKMEIKDKESESLCLILSMIVFKILHDEYNLTSGGFF